MKIQGSKMKNTLALFALILSPFLVKSQSLYSKAFGNPNDKAIIYLHGGPGYNSVGFEATAAKALSENGFYVITYDRRGEGRSNDKKAKFTFNEALSDLNAIYKTYHLESATLLGHSFGGTIAILFAEKYPAKTSAVILLSAPLSMQETLATILNSSKTIYKSKNDTVNLHYISMLEKMDKSSLQYSSYCFQHAMQNGFYYPKQPNKKALDIYAKFNSDTLLMKYGAQMTYQAPKGFWKNERYTSVDLKENLKKIRQSNTAVFGLYGKDDGLFSKDQIQNIQNLIGENNFEYLQNCSHNPFIDQQDLFIKALKNWIK